MILAGGPDLKETSSEHSFLCVMVMGPGFSQKVPILKYPMTAVLMGFQILAKQCFLLLVHKYDQGLG